MKSKV